MACPVVFSGTLSTLALSARLKTSAPLSSFRCSRHNRQRIELHCVATDGYNSGCLRHTDFFVCSVAHAPVLGFIVIL
jgi:hypothetical protein